MTEETKLTVIMPVYNADKYLEEALDDVLVQNEVSYELWCVEDCSDDNSYEILQEYQQQDSRIRLFCNKERKGAPSSRNNALQQVKTPYVMFLDADDRFEPILLESLYKAINMSEADIAYCEWDRFLNNDVRVNTFFSGYPLLLAEKNLMQHAHRLMDLHIKSAVKIINAPWIFMLRTEFIKDNSLMFQALSSRNDVYFFEMAKMCAEKMIHVETSVPLVHQRQHESPTKIGNNPKLMNLYYAFKQIKQGMAARKLEERYMGYITSCFLNSVIIDMRGKADEEQKETFLKFLREEGFVQLGISEESIVNFGVPHEFRQMYHVLMHGRMMDIVKTNLFRESLKVYHDKVKDLFLNWKGKKVAFWGVSQRMEAVQELFADDMKFSVVYLDTNKYGKAFANQEIKEYAQVVNQNDIIVVLNHVFEYSIQKRIEELGGNEEIFVLDTYIDSNI